MARGNNKTFSTSKKAKECKFSVECFVAFDGSITNTHTHIHPIACSGCFMVDSQVMFQSFSFLDFGRIYLVY